MIFESLVWKVYQCVLHMALRLKGKQISNKEIKLPDLSTTKDCVWVFCTTIGELNSCHEFLDNYTRGLGLVIVTDKEIYKESFLRKFPDAYVITLNEYKQSLKRLTTVLRPVQFIICEIPCLLHESPCRFDYQIIRDMHYHKASIIVINGWLYKDKVSCRQDYIEKKLFEPYYLRFVDYFFVQNDFVKNELLAKGCDANKISVILSFKFDSLYKEAKFTDTVDAKNLEAYSSRNIFLAGSLSGNMEFDLVIQGSKSFIDNGGLLIIAPRHPEIDSNIVYIVSALEKENISYTKLSDRNINNQQVLIVDTFGDLPALLYHSDKVYIGKNHNLIEPLSMGKPVATSDGWSHQFSTHEIFKFCYDQNLIELCNTPEDIQSFLLCNRERTNIYLPVRKDSSVNLVLEELKSQGLSVAQKC